MEERTNRYKYPVETTAERLAYCDVLDVWTEVSAEGLEFTAFSAEAALRIATERGVAVDTVQNYMSHALPYVRNWQGLSD